MNPLYHLSSPASPFSQSQIFLPPPQLYSSSAWLIRLPPKLYNPQSLSSTLTPSSFSYPQPLPVPEKNDAYSSGAAGACDISGGGGDRPSLACRPTSGPNDAGWGSAVRQATGWNCGNCWACGGVRILATALKGYGRINWNYINISKDFTSVQDTSILSVLNIGWRLFC